MAAFVVTGGVTEYHVMIHATDPKQTYREQMNVVLDAYAALLKKELSGERDAHGVVSFLVQADSLEGKMALCALMGGVGYEALDGIAEGESGTEVKI